MTAAFAAAVAACIAVTNATPIAGIAFAVAAALLSNIKALRLCTPAAVPLLMALCGITLPLKVMLVVYICCTVTAVIKKSYYHSLPILLCIAAVTAILGMNGSYGHSLTELALIPLIPCAAGCAPKSKTKGLCIALAVSVPLTFGGGRTEAVCLLLPALIPVLIQGGRRIQSFREE